MSEVLGGRRWGVVTGDALTVLRGLPDGCAQCCVTSPPYWGLRDYGAEGQLGLEPTPAEYVSGMVAVFAEVRRVLRDDGVCFVNVGDSYTHGKIAIPEAGGKMRNEGQSALRAPGLREKSLCLIPERLAIALSDDGWIIRNRITWAKGLSFCPTWSGSVMPSSATDRFTPASEHVWFMVKQQTYWFDQVAVRETAAEPDRQRADTIGGASHEERQQHSQGGVVSGAATRNLRDVWCINTASWNANYCNTCDTLFEGSQQSRIREEKVVGEDGKVLTIRHCPCGATDGWVGHYAAFPEALVEPCVLAGSSDRACSVCGAAWVRQVERKTSSNGQGPGYLQGSGRRDGGVERHGRFVDGEVRTTGFAPGCDCGAPCLCGGTGVTADDGTICEKCEGRGSIPAPTVGSIILDPFCGSGTTGAVAVRLGRRFLGIELNPEYVAMSERRIGKAERARQPALFDTAEL